MYSALMIDIVKSRSYSSSYRFGIQNHLLESIDALNAYFSNSIAKSVEFSAGDELQGLFYYPFAAYQYYRMLNLLVYPVQIRAGIGVGEWSIKIDGAGTTAQDGTAYHHARQAINMVKESTDRSIILYSQQKRLHSFDHTTNTLMQAEKALSDLLKPAQRNCALLVELISPLIHDNSNLSGNNGEHLFHLIQKAYYQSYEYAAKRFSKGSSYPEILNRTYDELISTIFDYSNKNYDLYIQLRKQRDPAFTIIDTHRRGIPTLLAEFTGTSRQNIEKTIESGHINTMRNIAVSIMIEMDKEYHV